MWKAFQMGLCALLGSWWLGAQLFVPAARAAEVSPGAVELDRGFEALSAGEWREAGDIFSELCRAFPDEALLFYYRAIAASNLGDGLAAVEAFAEAAALDPQLAWVQADLGIGLYQIGEFDLAEAPLLEALLQGPEDSEVLLYLGLLDLRKEERERAEIMFEESLALDPEATPFAYYSAAEIEAEREEFSRARSFLDRALASGVGGPWAGEAERLLEILRVEDSRDQRLALHAAIGVEHDDNLTVSESDFTSGIGDTAAVLDAGGAIDLIHHDAFTLLAGYSFSQTLHRDLSAFDLQSHQPYFQASGSWKALRPRLSYRYRNESYGGRAYLSSHLVEAGLEFEWLENQVVQLEASVEELRFDPVPERDATRASFRIGQENLFFSDRVRFSLSWKPEWQNARDREYDYSSQTVQTGLNLAIPWIRDGTEVEFSYEYESRNYELELDFLHAARSDTFHILFFDLRVPLVRQIEASLEYLKILSRSNIPELEYDENIITFKLFVWR